MLSVYRTLRRWAQQEPVQVVGTAAVPLLLAVALLAPGATNADTNVEPVSIVSVSSPGSTTQFAC